MGNSYGIGRSAGGAVGSEESASKMTEEPAAEEQAEAGWKTTSVSFRKAENGGVIASCSREKQGKRSEKDTYEDRYKSADYAFSDLESAAKFLIDEMGEAEPYSSNSLPATARG